MPALYGHPFSSYSWKALIALYSCGIAFEFRLLDGDHPENLAFVQQAGPAGKFPVWADGAAVIFEATAIIEHLAACYPSARGLIPDAPERAVQTRMLDRVFDNYVMAPMQAIVDAWIVCPDAPERERIETAAAALRRSYEWIEHWLASAPPVGTPTLLECAAAPALFYADWVEPIGSNLPRLAAWRRQLLAVPAVVRCIEEARPYRDYFPPGAPDRD